MYRRIDSVELPSRPDQVTVMVGLEWEELNAVAKRVENVFEAALTDEERAVISSIKETLLNCGAMGAAMSGSGSVTYGIFAEEAAAKKAAEALQKTYSEVFLTQPV